MTKKRNTQAQKQATAYDRKTVHDILHITLEWFEKYIEVAHKKEFPDWENRKQIRDNLTITRTDIYGNSELAEDTFSTQLFLFQGTIKRNPPGFRDKLKEEFYQWISATGINADNCPEKVKHFIFGINEILEGRGEKIVKDEEGMKRELDPSSPEYMRQMTEIFSHIQAPMQNEQEIEKSMAGKGWNDYNPEGKFGSGDVEKGKRIFGQISQEVASKHSGFHFFPQVASGGNLPSGDLDKIVKEVKENPQFWRLDDETPTEIGYFGRAKKQEWLLIHWDARDDYDHGKLNFNNNPIYRWESFNARQKFEIKVALNVNVEYLTEEEIKWMVKEVKNNPSIWRVETVKEHDLLIHSSARGNNNEIGTLIHNKQKFSDLEWKEINKTIIIQNIDEWEFRDVVIFNGIFNDGMKLTKYDNERGEKVFIKKSVQLVSNDYDNQGNLLLQLGKIYRESDFNREQWTEIQNALNSNSETHPNYNNWTKEQFIAEINRLKAENEQLRNNKNLASSVRQERLQSNQRKLDQLTSYINVSSQPNNSNNSFLTSWIIGGGLLSLVGLTTLLIVRNSKKKRKLSR